MRKITVMQICFLGIATALNVVGDSAASIYVAKSEGMLDETKYNA